MVSVPNLCKAFASRYFARLPWDCFSPDLHTCCKRSRRWPMEGFDILRQVAMPGLFCLNFGWHVNSAYKHSSLELRYLHLVSHLSTSKVTRDMTSPSISSLEHPAKAKVRFGGNLFLQMMLAVDLWHCPLHKASWSVSFVDADRLPAEFSGNSLRSSSYLLGIVRSGWGSLGSPRDVCGAEGWLE